MILKLLTWIQNYIKIDSRKRGWYKICFMPINFVSKMSLIKRNIRNRQKSGEINIETFEKA
jgi:hypothetical protein